MSKPILCLDFDGVIHSYMSGWKGADVIPDPPVPGAFDFLLQAVEHFRVAIYSSRSGQPGGIAAMQEWLANWLREWASESPARWPSDAWRAELLAEIEWPTEKPPALVSIDDRALTFDGSWPSVASLRRFQPWNKAARRDDFPVMIDREAGTIAICGVTYDFDLFTWFGSAAVGTTAKIVARADGVLSLEHHWAGA